MKIVEQSGLAWNLDWTNMTGVVSSARARMLVVELRRNQAACAAIRRVLLQRLDANKLDDQSLIDMAIRQIESGALVMSWHATRQRTLEVRTVEEPAPVQAAPAPAPRPVEPEPEPFPPNHD